MNREAVRPAFAQSVPVLFGYIFLGMAFGISMQQAGYGVGWAAASSLFIYAGAGQFMLVSLLANGYPLYLIACMTLLINSRHLFYGLTFIERFRTMGKRCFYMIFR